MEAIFTYSDPNAFLKDRWDEMKVRKPDFSVRAWAHHLGVAAHAPLHQMIVGKRKISPSYVTKFIKYFALSDREASYFDILVKFSRSQNPQDVNYYSAVLKGLRPKDNDRVEILDDYDIQKEPLHFFIMEMAELFDLTDDFKEIQRKLVITYNSFEIKTAIKLLLDTGHLTVDERGFLKKTFRHIYSAQDLSRVALVQYHQKLSQLAQSAVEKQPRPEREFNGISFNIDRNRMPSLKDDIRTFISELIKKYEEPPKCGDSTYQLNIQLFKIAQG